MKLKINLSLDQLVAVSNNFLNRLEDPQELAEALATGNYKHYKGLRYDYFEKIIQYGQVPFQEFKEIVIQDFIKQSAKIWESNHNVYVGEWRKAINLLQHNLFKNITGKENIIQKLREYRWKLNFARKWLINNNYNALYPSWYFDSTRTKQEEIGFYGLHKFWIKHFEHLKETDNHRVKTENNTNQLIIKMDKKYKSQGAGTQKCGQTVLSMILNKTVEEVIDDLGKDKTTCLIKDLKPYLQRNGYEVEFKKIRYFEEVPDSSIIRIEFQGESTNGHFLLKTNGKFYDPHVGVIEYNNEDTRFARAYLRFYPKQQLINQ
ncbi:hypothetical protein T190115A13A_80214 [Tenacibaculum sp. 190524A02b]|uniref:Zorya protein ZorC EH domain-containing protein n=1 Tax=Tenacibaculum vairaonense TaxID=3137860 RepID=A0ABM9PS46_9FLAO